MIRENEVAESKTITHQSSPNSALTKTPAPHPFKSSLRHITAYFLSLQAHCSKVQNSVQSLIDGGIFTLDGSLKIGALANRRQPLDGIV